MGEMRLILSATLWRVIIDRARSLLTVIREDLKLCIKILYRPIKYFVLLCPLKVTDNMLTRHYMFCGVRRWDVSAVTRRVAPGRLKWDANFIEYEIRRRS